jgi:hypothetical protein
MADELFDAATEQCRHAVERGRQSGLADHEIHRQQREGWEQVTRAFVRLMESLYRRAMATALEGDRDGS